MTLKVGDEYIYVIFVDIVVTEYDIIMNKTRVLTVEQITLTLCELPYGLETTQFYLIYNINVTRW